MAESNKATQAILEEIHKRLAEDMLTRLKDGACEAKDWTVIVKFLKDNDITALIETGDTDSAFADLINAANEQVKKLGESLQ
ncbi:hypothetical protein [Aquibium microcysteis]|uniref:hypothetical protein n=1 Tax=Aquibium microcysteis TaxID=675281 RepID=UPI00165D03EC|nr:hypothetical protein [Aquibium microcysteis]